MRYSAYCVRMPRSIKDNRAHIDGQIPYAQGWALLHSVGFWALQFVLFTGASRLLRH